MKFEKQSKVLVKREKQTDVAKLYKLSPARINQLSKLTH
jgi:hypothetical protein